MSEDTSLEACSLCQRLVPDVELAAHFESCFAQRECPSSSTSSSSVVGAKRRRVLTTTSSPRQDSCLEGIAELQTQMHLQREAKQPVDPGWLSEQLERIGRAHLAELQRTEEELERVRCLQREEREHFTGLRLQLEAQLSERERHHSEELSAAVAAQLVQQEEATRRVHEEREKLSEEWTRERLQMEEETEAKVRSLQREQRGLQEKLAAAKQLPAEIAAMETGEVVRITLQPTADFSEGSAADYHFRLAESQFLRMCGTAMANYRVSRVTYIVNPPLVRRYEAFKEVLKSKGEEARELLTFHGTTADAVEGILKDGFRIGGVDVPRAVGAMHGQGVYMSEDPGFAMRYIRDGRQELLLARVCLSADAVIVRRPSRRSVIQQLVLKNREQLLPCYLVHFEQVTL